MQAWKYKNLLYFDIIQHCSVAPYTTRFYCGNWIKDFNQTWPSITLALLIANHANTMTHCLDKTVNFYTSSCS